MIEDMAKKKKKNSKSKKTSDGGSILQPPANKTSLSLDDTEHGSDTINTSGHELKGSIPGDVVVDKPPLDDVSMLAAIESCAPELSNEKATENEETNVTVDEPLSSQSQDSGKEIPVVESSVKMQTKQWGVLPDVDSSDEENEPSPNEVEMRVDTSEYNENNLVDFSQMKEALEESSAENNSNNLDIPPTEITEVDSENRGSFKQVVMNSDNDSSSDSDSDDDGIPIAPYLTKKQPQDISHDAGTESTTNAKVEISTPTEKMKVVTKSKKKKEAPPPPKVLIDEDNYNIEDRGVRSGNMYLQNIRKEEEEREANKDARLFRPAVAARLASVKTSLESRVIAANRAREEEEQRLQKRRSSTSSIEWSYLKREKEQEEARLRNQREAEEKRLMVEFDAEGASSGKTWIPASVSMDCDSSDSSDSSDSDSDDDMIVPRNYGVNSDEAVSTQS